MRDDNTKSYIRRLNFRQRLLLRILSFLLAVWSRTLRLKCSPKVLGYLNSLDTDPGIIVLWHNRLFMGPDLCRRFAVKRQMAAIVSASKDGAWMGALLEIFEIHPVRGSSHHRGVQAMREVLAAHKAGHSILITPDGSRGPKYKMKSGAALIARESKAPVYLLALNFSRAWRLNSWDRFYVPWPFSRVELTVQRIEGSELAAFDSLQAATEALQVGMLASNKDAELADE
jgi:lysophospholipid acyltransferase (LPLAT)-like uncharacterized protein